MAAVRCRHVFSDQQAFSLGLSYDSSPVKNKLRTFDFPVDEYYKLSAAYAWNGINRFDYSLGATLLLIGDAKINETAQGVTVEGEFDTNRVLLVGGTLRYRF